MSMTTVFMRSRRRVRTMRMQLMRVRFVRMPGMLFVRVFRCDSLLIRGEHIDLGPGQPAAAHFAHLQPRTHIERGGRFL